MWANTNSKRHCMMLKSCCRLRFSISCLLITHFLLFVASFISPLGWGNKTQMRETTIPVRDLRCSPGSSVRCENTKQVDDRSVWSCTNCKSSVQCFKKGIKSIKIKFYSYSPISHTLPKVFLKLVLKTNPKKNLYLIHAMFLNCRLARTFVPTLTSLTILLVVGNGFKKTFCLKNGLWMSFSLSASHFE